MRIFLNTLARDNFSFFDPEYPLSLSLSNPGANVDHLTESMKRGIRGGTIIDVDNASEIEISEEVYNLQNSLLRSIGIVRVKNSTEAAETVETITEEPVVETTTTEEVDEGNKKSTKKK